MYTMGRWQSWNARRIAACLHVRHPFTQAFDAYICDKQGKRHLAIQPHQCEEEKSNEQTS